MNVTMDNADKVYYMYGVSMPINIRKSVSQKWKILSGTGKYKGIEGSVFAPEKSMQTAPLTGSSARQGHSDKQNTQS